MLNKLFITFTTVGVIAAVAAGNTYKVDILEDTVIEGKQVKAGTYKIEVENNLATLKHGKDSIQVPARTEASPTKYDNTRIQYADNALHEIHIGGTTTRIVFDNNQGSTSGGTE